LVEYLSIYTKQQHKRHLVRPGLSGLAQIKGRNSISWEKKINFDLEYLNKVSFLFDIKVIIISLLKFITFKSDGVESTDQSHKPNLDEKKENF
jgi:lipopolysaccharide/colanic/teichoic acid biosynthesis glycosyltransferase